MDESDDEDGLDAFFSGVSLRVNDLPAPVDISTDATDYHSTDDDDDIFNQHQNINIADLKPPPQSQPHNFHPDLASDLFFNLEFSNLHVDEPTPPRDENLTLDVESEEMGAMSNLWDIHAEEEPPPPFNMGSVFHYDVPPVNEGGGKGEEMANGVGSSIRSSGSEASYKLSDDTGSPPPLEEELIDVEFDLLTSLSRLGRAERAFFTLFFSPCIH
jgi:hypothetical protein